jgi:hypothetical protein
MLSGIAVLCWLISHHKMMVNSAGATVAPRQPPASCQPQTAFKRRVINGSGH